MSFVEMRVYELKPGTANAYVGRYLNQVIHMWRYQSFEERTEKRQALFSDPAWLEYVAKVGPMLLNQRNVILNDILS